MIVGSLLVEGLSEAALCLLVVAEVLFCALFYLYLIPRANRRTAASPYRDYGRDRQHLLFRILNRCVATAEKQGTCAREEVRNYILGCFAEHNFGDEKEPVPISTASSDSLGGFLRQQSRSSSRLPWLKILSGVSFSSSTADDTLSLTSGDDSSLDSAPNSSPDDSLSDEHSQEFKWTVDEIGKADVDALICWSLFGKHHEDFEPWELEEKRTCYEQMEKRMGLTFIPGSTKRLKAYQLNLEDVSPMYRPLLVYVGAFMLKLVGCLFLRLSGFQRVVSKTTGLVGWYRAARNSKTEKLLPLLFFHGIAPGGLSLYIPMVLWGLAIDGRATFMFENPNISCSIAFDALSEDETARGAAEIVDLFLPRDHAISVCGHSFGSCSATWLLHAPAFRHRIKQFVLLDPVSILLSESDVMVNFLYSKATSMVKGVIRMVAGSELFLEDYLRRHFYFYNS